MTPPSHFDRVIDRLAGNAVKWEKYRGRDVLPLWVADMDFAVAPPIAAALADYAARGDFGYRAAPPELPALLHEYCAREYDWAVAPSSIVWLPGLVPAIHLAVATCCAPDEAALTFSPIYPPFLSAAPTQERPGIALPLVARRIEPNRLDYEIDFDRLDHILSQATPTVRLLLLCHPHNPIGRRWRADELAQLAERVLRHDLKVLSDEVHADLALDAANDSGPEHRPFAALSPEIARRSITINGPGKMFNTAGLGIAWAVIDDPALRRGYRAAARRLLPEPCAPAYSVLQAALQHGGPWRRDVLAYLRGNRDLVSHALDAAGLPHTHPTVSYLSWFDARPLGLPEHAAYAHFEHHGLGLSDGADFGLPGHLRLNFGLPRPQLLQALERLARAAGAAPR